MKISIKTLKGDLFQVEAELTDSVLALKEKIAADKADFEVDRQKLIHAGKVLKDTSVISELGIAETDFIVCMVTAKPKAAQVPQPPAPAVPPTMSTPISQPITQSIPQAPVAASMPPSYETPEAIAALTAMGFPEAESRAALRAAQGNGNLAVEFLMTGIPDTPVNDTPPARAPAPAATASNSRAQLEEFRRHPNFTQLQRLVQENPAELNRVLGVIGQQNPALLAAIHENHEAFIAMMNEPIGAQPPAAPTPAPFGGAAGGNPLAGLNGPQLMQMMQSMPPAQRAMMAQSMGMSPEQFQGVMQMMASMPPEQLQQMMQMAPGMMGGMPGGMPGGVPGAGGVPTGAHVVRLTEEEMASVNRLMELGFTQQQAAQAFLAW